MSGIRRDYVSSLNFKRGKDIRNGCPSGHKNKMRIHAVSGILNVSEDSLAVKVRESFFIPKRLENCIYMRSKNLKKPLIE